MSANAEALVAWFEEHKRPPKRKRDNNNEEPLTEAQAHEYKLGSYLHKLRERGRGDRDGAISLILEQAAELLATPEDKECTKLRRFIAWSARVHGPGNVPVGRRGDDEDWMTYLANLRRRANRPQGLPSELASMLDEAFPGGWRTSGEFEGLPWLFSVGVPHIRCFDPYPPPFPPRWVQQGVPSLRPRLCL
jgi:hypothetical protein